MELLNYDGTPIVDYDFDAADTIYEDSVNWLNPHPTNIAFNL